MAAAADGLPGRVLALYAAALGREAHHLIRYPELTWQQLHNRLQWERDEAVATRLDAGRRVQAATGRRWIRTRSPEEVATEASRVFLAHRAEGRKAATPMCAWSPDGMTFASAAADVRLWDPVTGRELAVLGGHGDRVVDFAWGPDGRRIVTASRDRTLRTYDASSGACEQVLSGHGDVVHACSWNPDGTAIASSAGNGTLRIWRADGSANLVLRPHAPGYTQISWSPNGAWLASAGVDGLRVWNAGAGTLRTEAALELSWPKCAWHPSGHWLALGALNRSVHVFDAHDSRLVCGLNVASHTFAWSPDGRALAVVHDGRLLIWDVAAGRQRCASEDVGCVVSDCSWHPNGTLVVTSANDGGLRIWDAANCSMRACLWSGSESLAGECVWSPDGMWIASAVARGTARIHDAAAALDPAVGTAHSGMGRKQSGRINTCAWSPDGALVATAGDDCLVHIWSGTDARERALLHSHTEEVTDASWSPDGRQVASGGKDAMVYLWDITTGFAAHQCAGHQVSVTRDPDGDIIGHNGVHTVVWSPDGGRFASAGHDRTVRLWNARTGVEERTLTGHEQPVLVCTWSPDGRFLASAGFDPEVRVWDTARAFACQKLTGVERGAPSCSWSPDGQQVAAGEFGGVTRMWRVFDETAPIVVAQGRAENHPWSPDGRWLLVTNDGVVQVCSASDGTERTVLGRGNEAVWSPDGSWVAVAGMRGVEVYEVETGACVAVLPAAGFVWHPAFHPWRASLVAGANGRVALLDLVGIQYGPIVVTAVDAGELVMLKCPRCAQVRVAPREQLGETARCAACDLLLRVNPFTRG